MTQTKSGITTPSTTPYPAHPGHPDLSELAGTDPDGPGPTAVTEPDVVVPVPAVDQASRVEGLRAVRAERHRRRMLSVACAALVAACLVVTILIVGLARTRSSGPGAARPASVLTAVGRAPTGPSGATGPFVGPFVPHHPSTHNQAPRRH